jgi:hypothetical protein
VDVRRTKILTALVASLWLAVYPSLDAASSERVNRKSPPRIDVVLRGERIQSARPYTYCWSYSYGDGGVGMCGDGFWQFPRAARVHSPARIRLRINYPVKPREWYIDAYRAVVRHQGWHEAIGPRERITYHWAPHRSHGRIVAWDAILKVTESMRHYYIDTGGYLAQGDAYYTLHLRT